MITTQNRFEALKGNYDVCVYIITFTNVHFKYGNTYTKALTSVCVAH